ncbi:MAG TPA: response regulator [Candidatus Acidoferrales bacterium]|nr:response regulator [Candidatus Acidoferrales bacterium]
MPTILVADDNSNIQKMVSLVFQEKGITVVAVGNGEAACRKVPEVKPDIVLADVFMPVRNGYEVCEFVKRDSRFSDTPVVLLVGAFDPLDEKEARRVGADGVLKKPFVPPEPLISLVGALLQKSEKPEEVAIATPAPEPPPPPVAVAPPPPPAPPRGYQAEPEPEPQEDELSYGIASRDSDIANEVATTERDTVATPFAVEEEPQDDNTESASDWKRRREAMEYEIPAEESANLVEHLAGKDSFSSSTQEEEEPEKIEQLSEEPPAPAKNAETPQPQSAAPESPRVPASEWSSYVPAAEEEASAPASVPAKSDEIAVVPSEPAKSVEAPMAEIMLAPASEDAPFAYASPAQVDNEIEKDGEQNSKPSEFVATRQRPERDDFPTAPPSVIPFPTTSEPAEEFAVQELVPEEEVSAPQPSFGSDATPTAHAAVEEAVHEAIAQPESSKQAPMDQATIDSIVAKVVEKLEPQLHQALSQGVLKPLIQELLKGELKPNK